MAEISEKICIMCKSSSDDKQLGGMETTDNLNAHYFCLVSITLDVCYVIAMGQQCNFSIRLTFQLLSANLEQNGDDSEGIQGFLARDIMKEHNRASKLVNAFNF